MKGVSRLSVLLARTFSRRYTKEHEWVDLPENSSECSIGITDYAQNALGGVVYLSFPKQGQKFKGGEEMGEIESPKAVSKIYSPLALEVTSVNSELESNLGTINEKAEKTWLYKGRVLNKGEFQTLLTEEQYKDLIK